MVQFARLIKSLVELLPLVEHLHVVETGSMIVGIKLDTGFQKKFRIVENLQLAADLGQQPHRLSVVGLLFQEGPANLLRDIQLIFMEQTAYGAQFRRHTLQPSNMVTGILSLISAAQKTIPAQQRLPTRHQRRVEFDRLLESHRCAFSVFIGREIVAVLLVGPAILGVFADQPVQQLDGGG